MERNEIYLGTATEIKNIQTFLANARKQTPCRFIDYISLEQAENDNTQIDWDIFQKIIRTAEAYFKIKYLNFFLLPTSRYLISLPKRDNLGGFHGQPVGGYYYFNDLAFTTLLNSHLIPNKRLRTLELSRNYLHDSFHATTYKSFRINLQTGIIFRHQYGLNFRNANQISYSAPNLSNESPKAVNLNSWMDAVVHIIAGSFIKENFAKYLDCESLNTFEREIWNEISDGYFDSSKLKEPELFYNTVINPVKLFLNRWGKEFLLDATIKAMLSGDLNDLKIYFNQRINRRDAWEYLFRQSAYRDLEI